MLHCQNLKRSIVPAMVFSLFLLFFFVPATAASRFIVGVEEDYPPYSYRDGRGEPIGFNVELTQAIGKMMGLDLQIQMASWAEIRDSLERGDIHAIAGMYYSRERDKKVDFSTPYTIVHHTAIARKKTPSPTSEGALTDHTLIVMRGDIMHDYVLEKRLSNHVLEVPSQADALRQLAAGEGDYTLVARLPALYWMNELGLSNLKETGLHLRPSSYCFAVTEGDAELLSHFTEGLAILKETGRYRELYDRWLGILEPEDRTLRRILYGTLFLIATLALALAVHFAWVRMLRRQVSRKTDYLNQEIQSRKQAEKRLDHMNRILSAILYVSQVIAKEKKPDRLIKETCRCLTSTGGYFSGWIALIDRDGQMTHIFESTQGNSQQLMVKEVESGRYPRCMKSALKTSEIIIEEHPRENCAGCPLADVYKDRGAMTVRLHHDGRTFGVLSVSVPVHFLSDIDELALLGQVSSDLAFALHSVEVEQEQARLQRSLARSNIIVEKSPIVLFRWKAQEGWPVEFVSRNIRRFGYSIEDFLSARIEYISIIHPEDVERVAHGVQEKTLQGASHFTQEYRIFDKQGQVHWIEDRTSVERDDQGAVRFYQGVVFDISERKEAEAALRQSEERFRLLVEQASDSFFLFDASGQFIDVNRKACESLGYERNDLLRLSVGEIDSDFTVGKVRDVLNSLEHGQQISVNGMHRKKDGSIFPVEVSVSSFEWKGDKVYLGLARDVSERKKAEQERERLIQRLQEALNEVKTLKGLIPICSNCKNIRDDKGYWNQIESYLARHSDIEFSHGICPECARKLYPDLNLYDEEKKANEMENEH